MIQFPDIYKEISILESLLKEKGFSEVANKVSDCKFISQSIFENCGSIKITLEEISQQLDLSLNISTQIHKIIKIAQAILDSASNR